MSRSVWAAAGVSVLTLALSPGAALAADGSGRAAHRAGAHAPHHMHPRSVITRRRHSATSQASQRHLPVRLAPGSGYQQASARVRGLQRQLARLGFAPGPVDGRYGPLTTHAVQRFQAAAGLTVDGISGPDTQAALSATTRAALAPGAGYRQLKGSARVRGLQRRLAGLGFAPGPIDGRYGPLTADAVTRFQHVHDLVVTGVVTLITLRALRTPGHPAPRVHGPGVQPVPPTPPASGSHPAAERRRPERIPALPVTLVLVALGALGLAATALSYSRTRARVRRARPATPPRPSSGAPPEPPGHRGSALIEQGGPGR